MNLWNAFQRTIDTRDSAVALALAGGDVTFRELEDDALRCASWLATLAPNGLREGQVVALQMPKVRATFALWLACLRQGLVYSFLDERNPAGRTAQILERLRPSLLVTTTDASNAFGVTVRLSDGEAPWQNVARSDLPAGRVHGLSPAYVMFTSGSTGEPKGAVIPHQGISSLMRWIQRWIPSPADERFSNLNPLHFDNSVFDLYCGLLNGATLVPVDTGALHNPLAWAQALRRGRATVAFAVPTLFMTLDRLRLLSPESLPDLRVCLFGGEGFPIDALRRFHAAFAGRARLVNVYGPTETSCICSSLEVDAPSLAAAANGFVSLGRMHDDFTHAILDDNQHPVARGDTGELWIGGSNVGLGYFANPEETARRFRQDPQQNLYRATWYRSGDLVREDADGLLWFQGRTDNQVKVRGHRIELEEIDLALEALPQVLRAVAVVVTGADGPEIQAAVSGREPISLEAIGAHCAGALPAYMRPARIVQLDTLPENANGKVDRRAARELLERLN
jgi:D-alanine--poly(phosphoribitol) ligase subunit 1